MTTTWGSHYPFTVEVPVGDNIWKESCAIREWVKASFPGLQESTWDRKGDWYLRWGGTHYEVSFRCPQQTAMFKLAWGGK